MRHQITRTYFIGLHDFIFFLVFFLPNCLSLWNTCEWLNTERRLAFCILPGWLYIKAWVILVSYVEILLFCLHIAQEATVWTKSAHVSDNKHQILEKYTVALWYWMNMFKWRWKHEGAYQSRLLWISDIKVYFQHNYF